MKKTSVFSLVIAGLLSFSADAKKAPIATVVKMRGVVTKLLPGALEATVLENGDQLQEDTSIVTGAKSFVKIRFIDKSELNMGPESKIVISEMNPSEEVGIISLLKGRIRTEVEKAEKPEQKNQNKFYIRTRTAALGVRGTDFQTIYNPDNRVTSLLTYKGSVAMVKVDERTHEKFSEGETIVVRDDQTKVPEIKKIPGKEIDEKDELKKILSKNDTVLVKAGESSFSSDALKVSTLPVKISPVQLGALYKNAEFEEKAPENFKAGELDEKGKELIADASSSSAVKISKDQFAPRAGGYIDQTTALYIAPDTDNHGEVDSDTGQYMAPKGLVLDAKRGFLIDKNTEGRAELLALREDLNHSIARDKVVGDLDGEVVIAARTLREKFIRNRVDFGLSFGKEKLKVTQESSGAYNEINSDGYKFNILWTVASNNRFAPILGLSYAAAEFDDLSARGYSQDSKALFDMTAGLKYALTNRVDLIAKVVLDQSHYATQTGAAALTYQLNRIVVTKLNLGGEFELLRSGHFVLGSEFFGNIGFRKRFNNMVVSEIKGLSVKLMPKYVIDEKKSLSLGLFLENESVTLSNSGNINEQKRERSGAELLYTINM